MRTLPPSRAIAPTTLQRGLAADLAQLGRRGCEYIGCAGLFAGVPAFDAHRVGRGLTPGAGALVCDRCKAVLS